MNDTNNLALIATDLHIRPQHLDAAKITLNKILEEIKLREPKYLFILGDTFHYKDRLFASCLYVFQKFLEEVTQHCKVVCLVGNHDWSSPYTIHALESFRHIPNFVIVDDVYKLDEENGFISYCREKERLDEMREKLGPVKRLFGHLDINSFKVGSGWEEVSAIAEPDDFKTYKEVWSGHLHLEQERILSNGTRIVFVGTAYTTDHGESDQKKRFVLLDLDTGEYESIDTGMTLHKTLRIKADEKFPEIPLHEVNNGVDYRVIVEGTKEQIALIQKPKNYPARIIFEFHAGTTTRADLSVTDTRKDTLGKYIEFEIDKSFKDTEDFDKEKLLKIGENILNKFN